MEGKTSGKSKGRGKSIDPHGTDGKQKGKSIDPHGTDGKQKGKSIDPHGTDGKQKGKSIDPHGTDGKQKGKSIDPHGTDGKKKRKSLEEWKKALMGKKRKSIDEILKETNEINRYNGQIALLDSLISCKEFDREYPVNHEGDFENFYVTYLYGKDGDYHSLNEAQLEVKALMERYDEISAQKPESRKMNEYEEMIYNRSRKIWGNGENRGIISSFKDGKSTEEEESDLGSDSEQEGRDYGDPSDSEQDDPSD